MSRSTARVLIVFLVLGLSGLVSAQEDQKPKLKDVSQETLYARITLPWNNSSVRAMVPVFGFAGGKNFNAYRLEYGEGREPKAWVPIASGTKPYNQDPWSAGQVKWDVNRGARGTLGNWLTGLTSYRYGDWKMNLLGEYTLRLVVEGKDGQTVEDRVHVVVADVLTKVLGGEAHSPDGRFLLSVEKGAIASNFVLVSMLPSSEPKLPQDLKVIGQPYEFQPPGLEFIEPGKLQVSYTDADLDTNGDGKADIPADKLGLYYYEPVDEVWWRMPSRVTPATRRVTAPMTGSTKYLAYVALMADLSAPAAPRFDPVSQEIAGYTTAFSGKAEAGCTVQLLLNGKEVASCPVDHSGKFKSDRLPIEAGKYSVSARAVDPAGNVGQACGPIQISVDPTPPKAIKSMRWLGNSRAHEGERFLIELIGEDASQRVDHVMIKVSSASDKNGIDLEMTETGPQTGIYVALCSVGSESSATDAVIKAKQHGEKLVASCAIDASKKAELEYVDDRPPSVPKITCSTCPVLRLDTFEEGDEGKAPEGWRTLEGKFGAALSVAERRGNRFLRLIRQQWQSHMGAVAVDQPFGTAQWPVIGFDYLVPEKTEIDLVVHVKDLGSYSVQFTGSKPYYPVIGQIAGVQKGGTWGHALVPLHAVLRRGFPDRQDFVVERVEFVGWTQKGEYRQDYAASGAAGVWVGIDNFRVFAHKPSDAAKFQWVSGDPNGVKGYSIVFDRAPDTVPPQTAREVSEGSFPMAEPGSYYLHVRAVDGCGNWSRTNHFQVFSAQGPPQAGTAKPDTSAGKQVFRISLKDAGAGLDPGSVRVTVGDGVYDWGSGALSYDAERAELTVDPMSAKTPHLAANGEKLELTLAAADLLGQEITNKPLGTFEAVSPLRVTPPNPDGKNGFYLSPPKISYEPIAGEKALFEWKVKFDEDELSGKGQSLNALLLTLQYPDGKDQSFVKEIKLDTSTPETEAFVRFDDAETRFVGGALRKGAKICLRHQDYALETGALEGRFYRNPDFSGLLKRLRTTDLRLGSGQFPERAEVCAALWEGGVRPAAAGEYLLKMQWVNPFADLSLAVDGEVVARKRRDEVKEELEATVFLTKGWHRFQVKCVLKDPMQHLPMLVWRLRGKTDYETIPPESLASLKSLATTYYRWDSGPWQTYSAPLSTPEGMHRLSYYSEDLAGHREPVTTIDVDLR